MITVQEARKLISKYAKPCGTHRVPLKDALGSVIAEEVRSALALPAFDNSAMDGFALRAEDTRGAGRNRHVRLRIKGTVKAGDNPRRPLGAGETFRIMTGAPVPKGADAVVMKEEAKLEGGRLLVSGPVHRGSHIRRSGEEVRKGDRLRLRGAVVDSRTVGLLASLGKSRVTVFKKPKVSIVTTGSELVPPGRRARRGQIYDSNSFMVAAALRQMGIQPLSARKVPDRENALKRAASEALRSSDVLILMGGVSVGDYDYVKKILGEFSVKTVFWKVRQKPGKPLYFGRRGKVLVFGLPGNPASVFTCFYEYVFPALRLMSGFQNPYLMRKLFAIETDVKADKKKLIFLKGSTTAGPNGGAVRVLGRQGSHMISSLRETDCFILVPPGKRSLKKGGKVSCDLLPNGNGGYA